MKYRLGLSRRLNPAGALAIAIALPAAITVATTVGGHRPTTVVALLFVLGVVAGTSLAGPVAGVGTAVLSFLSLNFFFTPPLHTFSVGSTTDLVALVTFLAVSLGVGALLTASIRDRERIERRELELRIMNRVMTSLLAGESLDSALTRHADDVNAMLGCTRCVVVTEGGDEIELGAGAQLEGRRVVQIDLTAGQRKVGRLSLWPSPGAPVDAQVTGAFATQLALALESVRLSTEMKAAELEAESNRLKASLFSGVTHDVKTPLAAITASVTSMLEGGGFTEAQTREHLEMIKQETERLHRVVNGLLDLARLRAGALLPAKREGSIEEVIESVVARLRPLLGDREVVLRISDDLPEVPMDVVQIDQVLTNLIENAVKFSPDASPVAISAIGGPTNVRVTVADSGPGVSREAAVSIFEPFEKGSSEQPGTGLGLALARAIVSAHGGAIWVSQVPTGGAAFTFELPCGRHRREVTLDGTAHPAG